MRKMLLFLILTVASSCAVNHEEIDGPTFCSIEQIETYELGTNPGIDFDVTNLEKTTTFSDNDCPQVNNAPFTVLIDRVYREGDQLNIIENQFRPNQFILALEASGTDLLPASNSVNISNCSISREWSGSINTPGTTITINEIITYKGACQSTFYNPETDGNNG